MLVGGRDHLVVPDGAAGLDDRRYSGFGQGVDSVPEREEGVRSGHRAGDVELGLVERDAAGVDSTHLAGADTDRLVFVGHDDRVRLRCPADPPSEIERPHLRRAGLRPRRAGPLPSVFRRRVEMLADEPPVDGPQLVGAVPGGEGWAFEQAEILLPPQPLQCVRREGGGHDDLHEELPHRLRQGVR